MSLKIPKTVCANCRHGCWSPDAGDLACIEGESEDYLWHISAVTGQKTVTASHWEKLPLCEKKNAGNCSDYQSAVEPEAVVLGLLIVGILVVLVLVNLAGYLA